MKKFMLAAALALMAGGAAQAAAIEIVPDGTFAESQAPVQASSVVADLSVVARTEVVAPATGMSELPEPEVFAMMLVGLCLIGYRASRDSDEKFK